MSAALRTPGDLDDESYELFRELILGRMGVHFGPRRRSELSRGVLSASARAGDSGLFGYAGRLRGADTNSPLWDDLIAEISIGESYFFRDEAQMLALRTVVLPDLIARHQADRRLRIWSAGCSTGEEPFGLAMMLVDLLEEPERWDLHILGTDINRRAISQALTGLYRAWSFRSSDTRIRDRHFIPREGSFELRPEIRRMVEFGYLNLSSGGYPSLVTQTNALDLILWRNVAIYLSPEVVRAVAVRLHECLLPDGYLIVGAVEADAATYKGFAAKSICGATVFQKSPTRPTAGVVAPPAPRREAPAPPSRPAPAPRSSGSEFSVQPGSLPVDPRRTYEQGLTLVLSGRLDAAMTAFGSCLAAQPTFAPAHHALAKLHANRGELLEARRRCERALECAPGFAEAHYTLALICVESGTQDEAVGFLRKALYLEPDFALAHYTMANVLERSGRGPDAGRHRRHALRIVAAMPPAEVVGGSEDLTGGQLKAMLETGSGVVQGAGRSRG